MSLDIGESIGSFTIVARLGSGGMGDVFLAEQPNIDTKVAIKVLRPEISRDLDHVQRFFNEARAVSRIKHAGIVKIFEGGFHASGNAFLIMEFLDGESLASRIRRVRHLPLPSACDIGRQIASILSATHAVGITHRDLKPDNVFIVPDAELATGERVKILDFGIAKLTGTLANGPRTIGTMGTPAYMAPEQWGDSANVDWRADAYSLGCVLFEMLCSRPPFLGANFADLCAKHLTATPPSPSALGITVPDALEQLILRLLAKDASARATSLAEIGKELDAIGRALPADTDSCAAASAGVAATVPPSQAGVSNEVPATLPPTSAGVAPPRDLARESPRDVARETPRDAPREMARETPRDAARETPRDAARETPRDVARETPRDAARETPRDVARETSRDVSRDVARQTPPDSAAAGHVASTTTLQGASGEVQPPRRGRRGVLALAGVALIGGGVAVAMKLRGAAATSGDPIDAGVGIPASDASATTNANSNANASGNEQVDVRESVDADVEKMNPFVVAAGGVMLQQHQVTRGEYARYLAALEPGVRAMHEPVLAARGSDDGGAAIGGVSFERARAFCRWLKADVPTFAQWRASDRNDGQEWTRDVDANGLVTVAGAPRGASDDERVAYLLDPLRKPTEEIARARGWSEPEVVADLRIGFRCAR